MPLLIALLACLPQDDPAAEELIKKLTERTACAKTIRATFEVAAGGSSLFRGELSVSGPRRFRMDLADTDRSVRIVSDGRKVKVIGDAFPMRLQDAGKIVEIIRRALAMSIMASLQTLEVEAQPALKITEVRWEGTEKVGEVEASVVSYKIQADRGDPIEVKAWIDPASVTVVKREVTVQGGVFVETVSATTYDAEFPDADFLTHSAETLLKGRTLQVARSIELFARYTGTVPAKLENLVSPPESLDKDVFWPEGGFWLGAKPPADVPYSVDGFVARVGNRTIAGDRRAIVAPTDRLRRHFAARVRLALLEAAL